MNVYLVNLGFYFELWIVKKVSLVKGNLGHQWANSHPQNVNLTAVRDNELEKKRTLRAES